jgi:DNA invertase Pin-like site-specific DNA recombinase
VSTKEQASKGGADEGYSIPAQRQACHRKAESLGAVVVEEFIDAGESARSADRPELQRMLKAIATDTPDFLIVHKIDRLARNRLDDLTISLLLEQSGVQLVSCSENIDKSPSGKLTHGLMALIAEWYSSNLSSEVRTKVLTKVQAGGTPSRAPIGYLNVGTIENGREVRTVVVDPERAPLLQWAFEAYASGDYTLTRLTEALGVRGLTTNAGPRQVSKPLQRSRVHRMLRNSYYIGIVTWKGVQYEGKHEPIISRRLFWAVQAMLDTNNVGEKQRQHPHYLKGSIFCGSCGSRLCYSETVNRFGVLYRYFFCLGRHQKRNDCEKKYISVDWIEEQVEAKWRNVRLSVEYSEALRTILGQDLESFRDQAIELKKVATRKRQRLERQREKLLDAYYAEALPLDQFKAEQDRIAKDLARNDEQLATAELTFEQIE